MTAVLFVYGTLLQGETNHALLRSARYLGSGRTTAHYSLLSLGSFPALIASGSTAVEGELYEVTEEQLLALDRLEEHPHFYKRTLMQLEDGQQVLAYVLNNEHVHGQPLIASGSWRRHRSERAKRVQALVPEGAFAMRFVSRLKSSPTVLWAHCSSLAGVNEELFPLRMSGPTDLAMNEALPLHTVVLRSVLSVAGVPFDLHFLSFASICNGTGFSEVSTSLLQRSWKHQRTIATFPMGAMVEDVLLVQPRVPGFLPIVRRLVRTIFLRRHNVLRGKFGSIDEHSALEAEAMEGEPLVESVLRIE